MRERAESERAAGINARRTRARLLSDESAELLGVCLTQARQARAGTHLGDRAARAVTFRLSGLSAAQVGPDSGLTFSDAPRASGVEAASVRHGRIPGVPRKP